MDEVTYSYGHWMWLYTVSLDHLLQSEGIDLKCGANHELRKKELDYASGVYENIQFFQQRTPTVEDFQEASIHIVESLENFHTGKRRECHFAEEHEAKVADHLEGKEIEASDRKFIIGRERYLAEQFFLEEEKFEYYVEKDMGAYKKMRLKELFQRYLQDYPAFYAPYERIEKGTRE